MRHSPLRYGAGVTAATATIVIHGQREVDGLVLAGEPIGEISFGVAGGASDVYGPSDEREVHPESGQELVVYRYVEFGRPKWGYLVS